jgi:hypothetical protein
MLRDIFIEPLVDLDGGGGLVEATSRKPCMGVTSFESIPEVVFIIIDDIPHTKCNRIFANDCGNSHPHRCLAPSGLYLCFFPYPGRCPGLICHAPSGLRMCILKTSKLQSPQEGGEVF